MSALVCEHYKEIWTAGNRPHKNKQTGNQIDTSGTTT